ncbi:MAG TPA: hypothetical protein VJP79_06810, partial [Nitrososphaera sp.]|nr:hypothetical protein [Nitrososphaera sp.]
MIFAIRFIPSTNPATALAAPTFPIALDETTNIKALMKGSTAVAITTATAGSGLKLKCSPFDSGRTNMKMYQIAENQNAAKAGAREILASCPVFPSCRYGEILASPNTEATLLIRMPVARDR